MKVAKKKTDEEMKRLENTFIKPSDIDGTICHMIFTKPKNSKEMVRVLTVNVKRF